MEVEDLEVLEIGNLEGRSFIGRWFRDMRFGGR